MKGLVSTIDIRGHPARFADLHLDSWPTLVWDCGFDVAPESLYQRALAGQQSKSNAA